MPPKTTRSKTSKTATRAALQTKQLVDEFEFEEPRKEEAEEVEGERDGVASALAVKPTKRAPAKRQKKADKVVEQDEKKTKKGASTRATTKTATTATTTAAEGGAKTGSKRAGKRAASSKKKQENMSAPAAGGGRKRRQKASRASAEPEEPTREDQGEGSKVAAETHPPTKRRKNEKRAKQQPVEDTDSIVVTEVPPATVVKDNKKNVKKAVKISEAEPKAMEVDTPIVHHSHSKLEGEVFVMGQGDVGQLGLGEDMMERKKPHPVGGALEGVRVTQVVCGGMHTVALSNKGTVYTWGCNDEGALGRTITEGDEFTPGVVTKLDSIEIVQISAGDSHTAALSSIGIVYGWGVFRDSNGAFGFLPPPSSPSPCLTPATLYSEPSNRAVKISSGSDHIAVLTEHGEIHTIGCAEQGQLGRILPCFSHRGGRKGTSLLLRHNIVRFRLKRGSGKAEFSDVFCGPYHTFAVSHNGAVYAWGLNNYGQLCTGDKENRYQPELLEDGWIGGRFVGGVTGRAKNFRVASGSHHTTVCCDGMVFTCGRKEYGRLGHGDAAPEPENLTQVKEGLQGVKIVSVAAGGSCSFAVSDTGEVYSWGMGTNLQLGMSDDEDVWTPQKVTGKKIENRRTLDLSVGGQHTALLMNRE